MFAKIAFSIITLLTLIFTAFVIYGFVVSFSWIGFLFIPIIIALWIITILFYLSYIG